MDYYRTGWGGDNVRYESGHLGTTQFRLITNEHRRRIYMTPPSAAATTGYTQVGNYREVMGLPEKVHTILVGVHGDTMSTTIKSFPIQESGGMLVTSYIDGMWVPKYDVIIDAAQVANAAGTVVARTTRQVWEHRLNVWAHQHSPTVTGIKRATDTQVGGAKNTQMGAKSVTGIISGDTTIQNTTGKSIDQMDELCADMVPFIKKNYGFTIGPGGVAVPVATPQYSSTVTVPFVVYRDSGLPFGNRILATTAADGDTLELWQAKPFARAINRSTAGEGLHIIMLN
jgi:hypothetical protein